jgi:periplasmic divalent cation tolerance protein
MMPYCDVYITVKDEEEAQRIGRAMVAEKLAACVNIHPIKSIYRAGEDCGR